MTTATKHKKRSSRSYSEKQRMLGQIERSNYRNQGSKTNLGNVHRTKSIIQRFKEALGFGG